jgi:TolB-like protein/DNA-binding winged helix-turn-helix (wHTH) protein/Tfp pilus assembly protein PilF
MAPSEAPQLRFGVFELDAKNGELRRAGLHVRLQPQPFKVLALLASRAGEVVTREEIQEKVWGNETFVDFEHGLNFCIKQIRATLGDNAEVPRFIETLPKRGYRFIAPVDPIAAAALRAEHVLAPAPAAQAVAATAAAPAASAQRPRPVQKAIQPVRRALAARISAGAALLVALLALLVGANVRGWRNSLRNWLLGRPSPQISSLAVLPLRNLSGDPEQKYFADGMTDTLIGELGKIRRVRVPSFTSVKGYENTTKSLPQIARELGVDGIVEGSVQRWGDRVRVTVQLLDGRKDQHIWGDSYEGDLRDVLGLQHQVAREIASQIKVTLTPQETAHLTAPHLVNEEAVDAYMHGRFYWYKRTPEGFAKSVQYYERAIQLDPNYALAYAGLADSYVLLGSVPNDALRPREAMPRAKEAAKKALELDDTLAQAHATLAYVSTFYEWDWPAAEREFRRALELKPDYATARQWYAEYLAARGQMDEALTEVQRARDADPLELITHTAVAEVFYLSRQYDKVIEQCRKTLEFEPSFFLAHFHLGRAYLEKGMYKEAIAEFERAKTLSGDSAAMVMALGYAHARAGNVPEARRALVELQQLARSRYVPALYFAAVHTGLGDTAQALTWLNRAYQEHTDYLVYLKVEPMADPLRADPQFQRLLRRVGLS